MDRRQNQPQPIHGPVGDSSANVRSSDGTSVTQMMRKVTRKAAPHVPAVIRHNWITILVIVFIAWMTYVTIEVRQNSANTRALALENKHRITDIQESRITSCKQTYEVIQAILRASTAGQQLTPRRSERLSTLVDLADPKRCKVQTQPK